MKNTDKKLSEILGVELNHKEKQTIRGGEEEIGRPIMCICEVIGGGTFQGYCGLSTKDECNEEITRMYPLPDYDCYCDYWFENQ